MAMGLLDDKGNLLFDPIIKNLVVPVGEVERVWIVRYSASKVRWRCCIGGYSAIRRYSRFLEEKETQIAISRYRRWTYERVECIESCVCCFNHTNLLRDKRDLQREIKEALDRADGLRGVDGKEGQLARELKYVESLQEDLEEKVEVLQVYHDMWVLPATDNLEFILLVKLTL